MSGPQDTHFAVYNSVCPFDTVRTVGREFQAQGEKFELVCQTLHVRVLLFVLIEDEVSFPVPVSLRYGWLYPFSFPCPD